jgi:hypothetical protein
MLLPLRHLLPVLFDALQHMRDNRGYIRIIFILPTLTHSTHTTTKILLLSHSTRLLNQLPQPPNFALNHIVLGDDALQSTNLLDVGCERGFGVVELGME